MADKKRTWRRSPLQGRRSHDAMGFRHLQLAWHLLPSRDQEHRYRQAWKKHTLVLVKGYITHGASTLILSRSKGLKPILTISSLYLTTYWDCHLDQRLGQKHARACYPAAEKLRQQHTSPLPTCLLLTACPGPNDVSLLWQIWSATFERLPSVILTGGCSRVSDTGWERSVLS